MNKEQKRCAICGAILETARGKYCKPCAGDVMENQERIRKQRRRKRNEKA